MKSQTITTTTDISFLQLPVFRAGLMIGVIVVLSFVFARFFENLPIEDTTLGVDNIFYALDDWQIEYHVRDGLRNPPWSVLPLVPLASLVTRQSAWGVLVLFTLLAQILSVPQNDSRLKFYLALAAAVLSFPSLRNIADANKKG